MAAAAEAWKPRFRELVVDAEGRCHRLIAWKIVYARGYLAPAAPMRAAAAEEVRTILKLPEQALEDTAGELAHVMSLLGSVKEVAWRGDNGDAADQLPRILGLPDMTAVQRDASQKVRDARMLAIEAYHSMELCCDCLLKIRLLLHHPAQLLPGVDDAIEGQRADAYEHLGRAKEKVDACAALAARALQDVPGAAD
uniref:Uncharacterized protein n=1 Tax=Avena sativa TaxID=4498 RepID=A0ACD5TNS6_AVESA